MLSLAPVVRGWDFFQFEAGEELLDVREDGRGVERLAVVAGGTATQHEPRAAAGAGDVGEVTFMRNLRARVETETGVVGGKQVALGVGEQDRRRGRGGEDAFVQPEHERELQLGVARAVNGADENLVERGRNDADGEGAEAGFEDGQPFTERQSGCARGKGARQILKPRVHLAQDGGVDGPRDRSVPRTRKGVVPGLQAGLDGEVIPESAEGCGKGGSGNG